LIDLILEASLAIAGLAMILACVRLLRGPGPCDRAVALDVLTLIVMPLLVGVALLQKQALYLDVALVYAVLAFLGVTALARYYDRGI
jgi:multicomponent Na+:H+ antiporter subunit F